MTIEPILNTLILGHKMEANTTSYIIEKGKQTKSKKFIFTSLTPPHIWSEGPPLHANVHFSLTAGEKRTKHVFTPASCQTCEAAFRGQRVHRICCYCITHFSFCCLAYFLLRCSRPRSRRSSSSRALRTRGDEESRRSCCRIMKVCVSAEEVCLTLSLSRRCCGRVRPSG